MSPLHRAPKKKGVTDRLRTEDESSLLNYAAALLGRQMRTVAQLRRLLRTRLAKAAPASYTAPAEAAPGDAPADERADDGLGPWRAQLLERVIVRLGELGYLSDARFAASYTSLRKDNQRLGSRRVAQDLLHKGVHKDIVEREVSAAYAETSEETQARAYLSRKRIAQPARGDQKAAARILRRMVRAGFSPGVVFRILRSWNVAPEELGAGEDDGMPGEGEGDARE